MVKGSLISDVINQNTGISASIESLAKCLVSLLTSSVPDLHIDSHGVITTNDFNLLAEEICSDGWLVSRTDTLSDIVLNDRGLPYTSSMRSVGFLRAVSQHNNFEN
jgi:hypothetical protein